MLYSLKELIFGLNEFEKAKIDDRINQAFLLVPKIELKRLEDFEILEENIYKLKEQLRIKSSNLNRVIKSSKLISKKQVLKFIKDLENIRYDFLKEVFTKYDTTKQPITQTTQQTTQLQQEPEETQIEKQLDKEIIEEIENKKKEVKEEVKKEEEIETKEIKKEKIEISDETGIELIKEKEFTLLINNGKTPYLTIKFKEKFDLILLKKLSSLFFEIYQMHGTNIIVENNIALIIPRFQDDNLISLPHAQVDIEEISRLLLDSQKKPTKENNKESKEEVKEVEKVQGEYVTITDDFKKQEFKTKKVDEDSLDALLTKHQEEHKAKEEIYTTKPEENNDKIKFETFSDVPSDKGLGISNSLQSDETIEIIKKDEIVKSEPEIELIKKDEVQQVQQTKSEPVKKELTTLEEHQQLAKQLEQEQEQPQEQAQQVQQAQTPEKPLEVLPPFQFEIYRDENVIVYFKEDSKAMGTLCLTTPTGAPIHTLSNDSLSYITIFSKVFAGVLFEVMGCHGTNIIWSFKENTVTIIPRTQDDKVLAMWNPQEQTPEIIEKIKEQLLTTILLEQEKNKPKAQVIEESKPKSAIEEIKGESDSDREQRAKHLLDSLRRIP